jgi:hypothetical protein
LTDISTGRTFVLYFKKDIAMIEMIRKRFALSAKGAKDFCKGVLMTALLDVAAGRQKDIVYLRKS